MLQLWLQLISLLCCSEGERVSMCVKERRAKEGGTEAACASTRDLPHSRLPPLCSSSPSFSSLSPCSFKKIFLHVLFKYLVGLSSPPTPLPLLSFPPFLLLPSQFFRLSFLHCMLRMTPLILRSRSRLPPGQPQRANEELSQWAFRARICPF